MATIYFHLIYIFSMRTVFGDSEAGRRRLYQTADIVLLLLNQGMSNTVGEQTSHLHRQEGSQKYQMAVFLLIFAISMQIQFVSYFLESIADTRGEPGKREPKPISH